MNDQKRPDFEREMRLLTRIKSHPHAAREQKAGAAGALMALKWAMGKGAFASFVISEALRMQLRVDRIRHCRICCCTEDFACEGGCGWFASDVCTKCSTVANEENRTDKEASQ